MGGPGVRVDTAAFALENRSYFIRKVGSSGFKIGHQPTMKKVVSDRRASLDEDTEILQEVEIRLNLRDSPELGLAGERVADLENETRRHRADIAELDDLYGARGLETESEDRGSAGVRPA